ncbi:cytosolic carboxypeptidase Nna1 [Phlebotomus argentipes]|uniref:cytosolic carboxypeptidase Nna1 n=1 Tax=Phlebotomus argentipes TaxID=94469 RepID=UPI0028932258|nr:cytosolic carboxypeptidase Nna1 [Phlebotomus argentipes]
MSFHRRENILTLRSALEHTFPQSTFSTRPISTSFSLSLCRGVGKIYRLTVRLSFLGSFLSNSLKTNQLEVNTDAKTLRPIARLKEPRDLFALPKERDYDCPQQAARWPIECQVLEERIYHIEYVPEAPEPYYQPTGKELQPRPVGEENGIVIYNYNPVSAVNYSNRDSDSDSDDDDSSATEINYSSTPESDDIKSKTPDTDATDSDESGDGNCNDDDDECDDTSIKCKSLKLDSAQINTADTARCNNLTSNNLPQFSRSSVGGSKYLLNAHPNPPEIEDLVFESRFESGNLAKAVKITSGYYELYLRPDMYTNRHTQWFYFRVMNTRKKVNYRFSIVNLVKSDSLYNEGMRPLMYSTIEANTSLIGWRRCGENITYFRNDDTFPLNDDDDENGSYTLTFNIEFQHDNDTVYFAHSYPYTYSDLQDYLMAIQRHPVKSKYCKLRLLCRSLAGNNIYYLTVTAPQAEEEAVKKRAVVVSARVHPGETPSSWMMKGLMDFITGDSYVAKRLRHKFIFKLIPMLNPDGVIVGNTRSSLTGKDLNRQYRTVIRETYPSIWYTKAMIKRLMDDCGVVMYCDMHAHSRKHNVFIYGCENKRQPEKKLSEQVFPLMLHKNVADKFSFESCKFKIQKNKEGTGRIVVWMLGVTNSYTIEASFGGTTLGSRNGTHFNTMDYEQLGRAFCETLMDYYDENPLKERLRMKILNRLSKEGSSADEPLNIPLSDYSSDEGDTSSDSSENEANKSIYEGPCCQPLKVPPSSPVMPSKLKCNKKFRKSKLKRPVTLKKSQKFPSRPIMDIPTTDPGLDLCYSTSDEDYETDADIFGRGYKGKLVRKSPQLFTDTNIHMPPELIITSTKKTDDELGDKSSKMHEGAATQSISEFPPINISKRAKSWHSFNRCMATLKITNSTQDAINYDTADNLQLKLSLKKQIWAGAWPGKNGIDRSRPLSWGVSSLSSKKTAANHPRINDYDSESLLTACSQKLAAWQETERQNAASALASDKKTPRKPATVNGSAVQAKVNEKVGKNRRNTASFVTPIKSLPEEQAKSKRKPKSTLTKIVKATDFFTHLAKAKPKGRDVPSAALLAPQNFVGALVPSANHLGHKPKSPSKFRTGAIVVTAVQPGKKSKKMRPARHKNRDTSDSDSENAKTFVRKVRTKIKRKKSKSSKQ